MNHPSRRTRHTLLAAALVLTLPVLPTQAATALLKVDHDVSHGFDTDVNTAYASHWLETNGEALTPNPSHGGSRRQARSLVDGLAADVTTLNQANDIDLLTERGGPLPAGWARRLPDNSAISTSISTILLRKGNPMPIPGWTDMGRPGGPVITDVPKVNTFGVGAVVGGWKKAQAELLSDAGLHDQIVVRPRKK